MTTQERGQLIRFYDTLNDFLGNIEDAGQHKDLDSGVLFPDFVRADKALSRLGELLWPKGRGVPEEHQ